MNYEVVKLKEIRTAGIKARTSNSDKNMIKVIGSLWEKFFEGGVFALIPCKTGKGVYGIYTNYSSDINGEYDVIVGCGADKCKELPNGVSEYLIPAGKYAKFTVTGDPKEAVAKAWEEIWKIKLDRTYACDFEDYGENGKIDLYISVK